MSATHQDLEQAVADGHFRQDLYFRVKGVTLRIPPLRDRREDITVLAQHFLQRQLALRPDTTLDFSQRAIDMMLTHPWPGNVREIEQVVSAAVAMCISDEILPVDLQIGPSTEIDKQADLSTYFGMPLTEAKTQLVEAYERLAITRALEATESNVSAAARQLGIHRQSLQQKMTQLGIKRSS